MRCIRGYYHKKVINDRHSSVFILQKILMLFHLILHFLIHLVKSNCIFCKNIKQNTFEPGCNRISTLPTLLRIYIFSLVSLLSILYWHSIDSWSWKSLFNVISTTTFRYRPLWRPQFQIKYFGVTLLWKITQIKKSSGGVVFWE